MSENVIFTPTTPPQPGSPSQAPQVPAQPEEPAQSPLKRFMIPGIIGIVALLLIIVGVVFIFPLISGSGGNGKVELTYWGLWEDENVMKPILDDFHAKHQNITVKYTMQDPKQYRERLLTRIREGEGPDIYRFHNTWVPMLLSEQAIHPLSEDVITVDDFKKRYYPVMSKDMIRNGALYGIPLQLDTLALFVNETILEAAGAEVPTLWEDFTRVAKLLTVPDENGKIQTAGAAMGSYDNITHAPDILSMLFLQSQVDVASISGSLENVALSLEFYTRFSKGEDTVWDATLDPSLLSFANGKLAMYFGYSWDVFAIRAADVEKQLRFSVHPVPRLPGQEPITVASYWVEGVSAESKNQEAALLFMKFLTEKEILQKLYTEQAKVREFGELYPQTELADLLKDDPLIYPFIQQGDNALSSYYVSNTRDGESGINTVLSNYLGDAVRSITDNNTSPQSAAEKLVEQSEGLYQKYGFR